MPAVIDITGYADDHSHPSSHTFNSVCCGLQNDYPSDATVNSIVTSMFPSNLPNFQEDGRLLLVLKNFNSALIASYRKIRKRHGSHDPFAHALGHHF